MNHITVIVLLFVCLFSITSATVDWLKTSRIRYPEMPQEIPEEVTPKMLRIQARAYLPPRYRDLFGTQTQKVREGSAFLPQTISEFTNKLGSRRQTFSWQPSHNVFVDNDGF